MGVELAGSRFMLRHFDRFGCDREWCVAIANLDAGRQDPIPRWMPQKSRAPYNSIDAPEVLWQHTVALTQRSAL